MCPGFRTAGLCDFVMLRTARSECLMSGRCDNQAQGMTPDILLANQGYENLLIGVVQ
jgi:hypothetical protein